MADLNQSIDLGEIFSRLREMTQGENIFGSKLFIYFLVCILSGTLFLYLTSNIYRNQDLYDVQRDRKSEASSQLIELESNFKKTIMDNGDYFKDLSTSPMTKSDLSTKVTLLVSKYGLTLDALDLTTEQSPNSISIIITGSYLMLIKFSNELNAMLSASQIEEVLLSKHTENNGGLSMSVKLNFSPPPDESVWNIVQ
jgi:hypothetical protein